MTTVTAWNSIDGLPKQFIASLKVLFDILDERNCGYIRFTDIEARWHEEGVRGLPRGVTEALRKVTPANGFLSFDRFVAGLKLALLTSQNKPTGEGQTDNEKEIRIHRSNTNRESKQGNTQHPESGTPREIGMTKSWSHQALNRPLSNQTNTAAVRPNNVLQHGVRLGSEQTVLSKGDKENIRDKSKAKPVPPPRPERPSQMPTNQDTQAPPKVPPRDRSKNIIMELKNWQRRVNGERAQAKSLHTTQSDSNLLDRKVDHKHDIYGHKRPHNHHHENIEQVRLHKYDTQPSTSTPSSPPPQKSATVKRRDSARRHTLANGVDYNMIKRMKQLEQEKDSLLKGLDMVQQAREWYHKQIVGVEEKQKYIGKTSYHDYSLEANQERMNFQYARIMEVNQQLRTLIESSERGFPLHMNLAVGRSNRANVVPDNSVKTLKNENEQLTKELQGKKEKISQLEKEKASLIRDLFETRAKGKSYDDTTFM